MRVLRDADVAPVESVTNLNHPGDYARARELAAPEVLLDGSPSRAWRLGDVLGGRDSVTLNGKPVDPDPELPLAAGDIVSLSLRKR